MKNDHYFLAFVALIFFFFGRLDAQVGEALDFDGTDDYVDLGDNIENLTAITIEAWIYQRSDFGQKEICSKYLVNNFSILDGKLFTDWGNGNSFTPFGDQTSTAIIPLNAWTHVAVSWDGQTCIQYINGVLDNQQTINGVIGENARPRLIGAIETPFGTANLWDGILDEVRIWDYVRCGDEIFQSKDCKLTGNETGLVAYYNFNQGVAGAANPTETSLIDQTANNYDGTLNNFTLDGATSNWSTSGVAIGNCVQSLPPEVPVLSSTASEICVGDFVTLSISAGELNSADDWKWYEGSCGGGVSFDEGLDIDVAPMVTTTYFVRGEGLCIRDEGPCALITIVVKPKPVIDIMSNTPVCVGEDIELMEIGNESASWSWSYAPTIFFSTEQNPVIPGATIDDHGQYTIAVVGINGCTNSYDFQVSVISNPVVSLSSNSPLCEGEDLTLFETGGDGYSWSWTHSSGYSSTDQNPLIPNVVSTQSGEYSVTVLNILGCAATDFVEVVINDAPAVSASSNSPVCVGGNLELTENGGDAISWQWSNSDGNFATWQNPVIPNVTIDQSGTYTVVVVQDNGCTNMETIDVVVGETPAVFATSNSPVCKGGDLQLMETGGDAVSWSWIGPQGFSSLLQNPVIENVLTNQEGFYQVTITDVNGCIATGNVEVAIHDIPTVNILTNSPVCEGGDLQLSLAGNPGVSWSWIGPNGFSSMEQNPEISSLSPDDAGLYSVTITFDNGCFIEKSATVEVMAAPEVNIYYNSPVCEGDILKFTAPNGTVISWFWTGPDDFTSSLQNPVIPDADISNQGEYFVTITDGNGCANYGSVVVSINLQPEISLSDNSPICEGGNLSLWETGAAAVSWQWSGPDGYSSNQQNPVIGGITPSGSGDYFVTITDLNDCTNTESTNVLVRPAPKVILSSNSPVCVGDDIQIQETGGDAVIWNWASYPAGFHSSLQNPVIYDAEPDDGRTYLVLATDVHGCSRLSGTDVVVSALPSVTLPNTIIVCEGEDLQLSENSAAGNAVSWSWSGPQGFYSNEQNPVVPSIIIPQAGAYGVTLTSADGCTNSSNVDVIVLQAPDVFISSNSPLCFGEDLTLFETGGDAVSWSWFGPNAYSSTQNNPVISDVGFQNEGTYSVTVTNNIGCSDSAYIDIGVNPFPFVAASNNSPICEGDDIVFVEYGGDGVSWSWSGPGGFISYQPSPVIPDADSTHAGTYFVTVTSPAGCEARDSTEVLVIEGPQIIISGNNLPFPGDTLLLSETGGDAQSWYWTGPDGFNSDQQSIRINDMTANNVGTYTVRVTAANGCTRIDSVNVIIINGHAVAISNSPVCEGEDLQLMEVAGGAVSWEWSGPEDFSSTEQNPVISGVSSEVAGTYLVITTDSTGTRYATVVDVEVNAVPVVGISGNSPVCLGDTLFLSENGSAVSWAWKGPQGFSSALQNPTIPNMSSLNSGVYYLSITDANGCKNVDSLDVEIRPRPDISVSGNGPVCEGKSIQLEENGGAAVSWLWTGPGGFTSTLQNPEDLNAEITDADPYIVTIRDSFACTNTASIEVEVLASPDITVSSNSPVCEGEEVLLSESGGAAVSWLWNGPQNFISLVQNPLIPEVSSLDSGIYFVRITDVNGCTSTVFTEVEVNAPPEIAISGNSPLCEGDQLQLYENAGDAISWKWSGPGGFVSNAQNPFIPGVTTLNSGTYYLSVINAAACKSFSSIEVIVNPVPVVNATGLSPVPVGETITLSETGGEAVSWQWSGPDSFSSTLQSPAIFGAGEENSGTYSVTITNPDGCMNSDSVEIIVTDAQVVTVSNSPLCEGEDLQLEEIGGYGVEWQWSGPNGFSSSEQNPLIPEVGIAATGIYTVTITNTVGLNATASVEVAVNVRPVAGLPDKIVLCEGDFLQFEESGGTAVSWEWKGPGDFSSNLQNPVIPSIDLSDSGVYIVTVTDVNGCMNTTGTKVIVNKKPEALILGSNELCEGEDLFLSESGGDAITWEWSGPNGYDAFVQNPTIQNATNVNSGVYVVKVKDFNECSNSDSLEVVVFEKPMISVSSNSPVVIGGAIELSETGQEALAWQWIGPGGFSSDLQNPVIPNADIEDSGVYVVTIFGPNGCSNLEGVEVNVTNVLVVANTNSPLCSGDDLQLSETGGDAVSWQWSGPGGFTSNEQNPLIPSVGSEASGIYSVTITNAFGHSATENLGVTVNAAPDVIIGSNSPLCDGETLQLETGGQGVNWLWSGPDGFNSTVQNPSILNATPPGSGTYSVTLTDTNSCSNSGSLNVSINSIPAIEVSGNSPVIIGETIMLSETGGSAFTWLWNGPGGFVSGFQNVNISNASVDHSGVYAVSITGMNGCENTADINVIVTNALAVATSNSPVCEGENLQLMEIGGQGVSWQWSGPNGFNSSEENPIISTAGLAASGTYEVMITTSSGVNVSSTVEIVINPLPAISISSNSPLCDGDDLQLEETSGMLSNWTWSGPDAYSASMQNPAAPAGQFSGGTYHLFGTDSNGCTAEASLEVELFSGAAIESNFLAANTACLGDTIHFIEISETDQSLTDFFWDFGDHETSTDRDPTHVYTAAGEYQVQVEVFHEQCGYFSSQKTLLINDCRSLDFEDESILAHLAPNPNSGRFRLEADFLSGETVQLQLFNEQGILLDTRTLKNVLELNEHYFISHPGFYVLKMKTEKTRVNKIFKVVVD